MLTNSIIHIGKVRRQVMGFGSRMRQRRKQLNMSQQDIATALGWSGRGRVSQYELEEREPKRSDIERLARALDTTAAWLQFGTTEKINDINLDQVLDDDLLSKVLLLMEQGEEERGMKLDSTQRAKLITVIYEDAVRGSSPDMDRVRRLMKLVT